MDTCELSCVHTSCCLTSMHSVGINIYQGCTLNLCVAAAPKKVAFDFKMHTVIEFIRWTPDKVKYRSYASPKLYLSCQFLACRKPA